MIDTGSGIGWDAQPPEPPPVMRVVDVDRAADRFVDMLAAAPGFDRADADPRDEGRLNTPGY